MASTFAEQLRIAIVEAGVARYRLEMQVADPGDLPDSEVFLMRIGSPDDPKTDELERVIEVGDFFTFGVNRSIALTQGDAFYRTASVIKTYGREEGGIETAINAKDFLAEEVNRLVEEYQAYATNFLADPPELFEFPEPDVGVLTPLIEEYAAKTAEVEKQEELLADKTVECARLDQDYQNALNARDTAQASLDGLLRAQAALQTALTSMNTYFGESQPLAVEVAAALAEWNLQRVSMSPPASVDALDDHMLQDPPGPPGTLWDKYFNDYAPASLVFFQDIQGLTAESTEVGNAVTAQQNARDDAQGDLDLALQAKETCEAEQATISAVLDKLKQQQTALLADIIALCPSFTPPV